MVSSLSPILVDFLFRLSFGVALAVGLTSAALVTHGFFRIQLWVLLGITTLAGLLLWTTAGDAEPSRYALWLAGAAALLSYFGSVAWLYGRSLGGKVFLFLVSGVAFMAAVSLAWPQASSVKGGAVWSFLDVGSGGFLLGTALNAMLLGHWYLNTPTMELVPLRRLILLLAGAGIVRAILCGVGLSMHLASDGTLDSLTLGALALRWIAGIFMLLVTAWMGWQTLKIPNTQSATGILYVSVILVFIGELSSQLLSANVMYPL